MLIQLRIKVDEFPMPQAELDLLQDEIITCQNAMKSIFSGGASHFQFIKFHMISHVPWQIKRFGQYCCFFITFLIFTTRCRINKNHERE